MTERDKHLEQFRDLTWFIERPNQGFEHLVEIGLARVLWANL